MAWPGTNNAQQQQQVEDFAQLVSIFSAALGQLNQLALAMAANWNGGTSTLVQSNLSSDDIIPLSTGLAGAQPLSAADCTNLAGYAINLSNPSGANAGNGTYNTAFIQALIIKACGVNASIGLGALNSITALSNQAQA